MKRNAGIVIKRLKNNKEAIKTAMQSLLFFKRLTRDNICGYAPNFMSRVKRLSKNNSP